MAIPRRVKTLRILANDFMNTFNIDYDEYIDSITQSILNIPEIKKALEHWKEMHMLPKGE